MARIGFINLIYFSIYNGSARIGKHNESGSILLILPHNTKEEKNDLNIAGIEPGAAA